MWKGVLVLTLCGLSLDPLVECGLTLAGEKCGVKTCKLIEYCSEFDGTCQPCSGICNDNSHNYERLTCEKKCQDFIHDSLYHRRDSVSNVSSGDENLRDTVDRLSRMVTGTLTVVCLMLIVLFCFLSFQLYRWKEKKNITLSSLKDKILGKKASAMAPEENTPARANNFSNPENNRKTDLKLDMPTMNLHGSDHSPVTVTTSISRRPAEDSTLDYAYDNPAMSASR